MLFCLVIVMAVSGWGLSRHAHTESQIEGCRRQLNFMHQYVEAKTPIGDLISLAHAEEASFGIADGKARDALHALDKSAQTPLEHGLVNAEEMELHAYEGCRRTSLQSCFAEAGQAEARQQQRLAELEEVAKPCDQFHLPVE